MDLNSDTLTRSSVFTTPMEERASSVLASALRTSLEFAESEYNRDTAYTAETEYMPYRILVVEDDSDTSQLVRLYLARDGHEVLTASDGLTGLAMAREESPDLILLDLMLPGLDGIEICRELRSYSNVPIIMVTARVEEDDRLVGLDLGADDYVTKPFSPRELAARVRAVLRRTAHEAPDRAPAVLERSRVFLDFSKRQVRVEGIPVTLTRTEFDILAVLMRSPGRVFSREEIIDRVFGDEFDGFDRTIDTHVSNLRRKLHVKPDGPRYISTTYGVGYRFDA